MPQPRQYQTEAIIIKKTRLREADRILTFYTPDYGKIQAVAKGVRKPKSKMAGHLELLTHSQLQLARGRNLDTVTGSQTITAFYHLKTNLELTANALYATELLDQFVPEHAGDEPLFRLFLQTLTTLETTPNRALALRYFEMQLLEKAGYRPQLQRCVNCHQELAPADNVFSTPAGGLVCPLCRQQRPGHPLSVNAQKALRFLQRYQYETVSRLVLEGSVAEEIKTVLRQYIRYLLEKDLRSTDWLDSF